MHFNHLPMGQKTQILKKLHRHRDWTDDNQHFCRIRLERIVVCRWLQLMLIIMTQINLMWGMEKSVIPDNSGKPVAQWSMSTIELSPIHMKESPPSFSVAPIQYSPAVDWRLMASRTVWRLALLVGWARRPPPSAQNLDENFHGLGVTKALTHVDVIFDHVQDWLHLSEFKKRVARLGFWRHSLQRSPSACT